MELVLVEAPPLFKPGDALPLGVTRLREPCPCANARDYTDAGDDRAESCQPGWRLRFLNYGFQPSISAALASSPPRPFNPRHQTASPTGRCITLTAKSALRDNLRFLSTRHPPIPVAPNCARCAQKFQTGNLSSVAPPLTKTIRLHPQMNANCFRCLVAASVRRRDKKDTIMAGSQ